MGREISKLHEGNVDPAWLESNPLETRAYEGGDQRFESIIKAIFSKIKNPNSKRISAIVLAEWVKQFGGEIMGEYKLTAFLCSAKGNTLFITYVNNTEHRTSYSLSKKKLLQIASNES